MFKCSQAQSLYLPNAHRRRRSQIRLSFLVSQKASDQREQGPMCPCGHCLYSLLENEELVLPAEAQQYSQKQSHMLSHMRGA